MIWCELGPFTVFDVETTGMSPVRDRIVEIAAMRIDKDGKVSRFSTLVNPGCNISWRVSLVHHITNEMVADAPSFEEIGGEFLKFAAGTTLVAHNAKFDAGFLQESLLRSGFELWTGKILDSLALVRSTHPGLKSYKLQNLRITLDLQCDGGIAHRAASDVEWTAVLLQKCLTKLLGSHNNC